jgi:hypothetical protein
MKEAEFSIRSYSHKELAVFYDLSSKTFSKWVDGIAEEIGPRMGNFYTPKQVAIIVEHFGPPRGLVVQNELSV